MNYLSQYPTIGALIFVLIVVGPIALAVYRNNKKGRVNKDETDD
tara:strand:- start:192 stop:323 length:132 start_codon:yes stop_codon:yes gene_type:complete